MLIRWLLNHLLFGSTMFFAAAPVLGGGAGSDSSSSGADSGAAGDVGAGSGTAIPGKDGGGDGADHVGDDHGSDTAGIGEDAGVEDFGTFEDFAADENSASSAEHDEFGPETYQTIKQALKDKPEVFKSVKKAVSMVKRFQEHFETPEAAGELLGDLQQFGGWDTIKQDLGETATFLNGYNAGDKEVVSRWLEENPDGLVKNMPTILDKWRAVDQDGWAHDAAQTFKATLLAPNDQTGLSPLAALRQLGQIEGVKDSDAYKTIMQRIDGVIARADQEPAKPAKVADDGKLSQREERVKQEEAHLYRMGLAGKAAPIEISAAKNALKLVAGTRKLTPAQEQFVLGKIHSEFATLAAKDPEGVRKRNALRDAGQSEQWLKLVKSTIERTMPMAARRAWRAYAGISGMSAQQKAERRTEGQQRRESGSGGATQGLQTLSPGDGRQVDWDAMRAKFGGRDKADEIFAFGLKGVHGGKRVWIKKGDPKTIFTY